MQILALVPSIRMQIVFLWRPSRSDVHRSTLACESLCSQTSTKLGWEHKDMWWRESLRKCTLGTPTMRPSKSTMNLFPLRPLTFHEMEDRLDMEWRRGGATCNNVLTLRWPKTCSHWGAYLRIVGNNGIFGGKAQQQVSRLRKSNHEAQQRTKVAKLGLHYYD